MSAEQNIETAKQMYEAFGRGDVQAILDRVTGDVDWSTDAAIASAPWYGPKNGKDELVSFFQGIAETGPSPSSPRRPSPATTTATSWCSSATPSPSPPPASRSR
jgi:ketosteroid isomerase-like protein